MPKPTAFAILLTVICLQVTTTSAQEELDQNSLQELIYVVASRSASIEQKITKQTEKFISRTTKLERRLLKEIGRYDSVAVMQWSNAQKENDALLTLNPEAISNKFYSGYWDSLSTALRFIGITAHQDLPMQDVLNRVSSLQERFQKAEMIKSILLERSKILQESLQRFGLSRYLKLLQKQGYYFHQQLRAYKALWERPSEIEQKLLKLLSETEAFKSFFLRHSQLASLFALPSGNTATGSLVGLQTVHCLRDCKTTGAKRLDESPGSTASSTKYGRTVLM